MFKLSIYADQKKLNMEMDNPSDEAKNHAMKQAFALFNAVNPKATPPQAKKCDCSSHKTKAEEPATKYVEPPRPVFKVADQVKPIHLQNHTETKATTMNEAVKEVEKKEIPQHVLTGIKMSGGKPAYRCRYTCPKCKHDGTHYVWPNTSQVDCWQCQTSMVVTKAVKGVTLMPDKQNNFYVAGDKQPVIDLTYANQKEKINILKKHNLLDKDFKGNV